MAGRGERLERLLRGAGSLAPGARLARAAGMFRRLGPLGFAQVLQESVLGPPPPRPRGGPHPPADGPPPVLLPDGPLLSVLVSVGPEANSDLLAASLASVAAQSYAGWELCVSGAPESALRRLEGDPRLRRVEGGPGEAARLNRALELARGEMVLRLDAGDLLGKHALAWIALALGIDPRRDLVYSDEDRLGAGAGERRVAPRFKPGWSPERLLSLPYLGRLAALRRELVRELGGYRAAFAGALDYDLALRLSERARAVHHVPRILYHAAPRLLETEDRRARDDARRRALEDTLARRGVPGSVLPEPALAGAFRVQRRLSRRPRVALLIPTRDRLDLLGRCLKSHWERTRYPHCDVLVVDDGSRDPGLLSWLQAHAGAGRLRVLRRDAPFNFSALMNAGAEAVDAEMLVFLNDDVEVLAGDWVEAMLEHALQPEVGAVGARLLYPDATVQHAGVALGIGPDRVAGHGHHGEPAASPGYLGRARLIGNCAAVTAACMMVRRETFLAAGGFDADALPISFNDVDLCLRLARRGLRTVYTPYACLQHVGSASRPGATDPREIETMRRRWGEALAQDPYYSPHLTRARQDFTWDPPAEV